MALYPYVARLGSGLPGNIGAQGSALIVQLVVALVSVPIFAGVWGLQDYGVWLLLFTLPALVAVSDLGFIGAVGNHMTAQVALGERRQAAALFAQLTGASALLGAMLLASAAIVGLVLEPGWLQFASDATADKTGATILALTCFATFSLWSRTLFMALKATSQFALGTYTIALTALLDIGLAATFVIADGGLAGAALGYALGEACGLLAMALLVARRATDFRPKIIPRGLGLLAPLLRPAVAFSATVLGQSVLLQGSVIVLGAVAGANSVPAFAAVRTLARLGNQAIGVANLAVSPELTVARARADRDRVADLVSFNMTTAMLVAVPIAIVIAVYGPAIVDLWSGGVISASRALCIAMAIGTLLSCMWGPLAAFLTADNKQGRFALPLVAMAAAGVLLVAVLGPQLGATGAAIAMVAVDLVMFAWLVTTTRREGYFDGLSVRAMGSRAIAFTTGRLRTEKK